MPVLVGILKQLFSSYLSFGGGIGGKERRGWGGVSDPKCNKMSILKDLIVAAKRFKLIIMF